MNAISEIYPVHGVPTLSVISDRSRPLLDHREYERLASQLEKAARDPEVRIVVLRGLEGCFCRGGDIDEFLDQGGRSRLIAAVSAMFRSLATFPKPLIASVEGEAIGVGCTILFHCDVVVAERGARFRVPFVDYGLVPDAATSILAPRRMGYAEAFRFFCLGDELEASEARLLGFVSRVVGEGEGAACASDIARKLARKPADSLRQTRALLRGDTTDLCDRIGEEIDLFRRALEEEVTQKRLRRLSRLAA